MRKKLVDLSIRSVPGFDFVFLTDLNKKKDLVVRCTGISWKIKYVRIKEICTYSRFCPQVPDLNGYEGFDVLPIPHVSSIQHYHLLRLANRGDTCEEGEE